MFKLRKGVVAIITLIILIHVALAQKQCNATDLVTKGCSETETCVAKTNISLSGHCDCIIGYKRENDAECKPTPAFKNPLQPSSSSLVEEDASKSHLAAAIIIPLFVVVLVICGIYITHRYKFYNWMHNKIYQRNLNYDEVMIGQDLDDDDPPLR